MRRIPGDRLRKEYIQQSRDTINYKASKTHHMRDQSGSRFGTSQNSTFSFGPYSITKFSQVKT